MWRRRLRELTTWVILALVLGVFASFVWFTHHPKSPLLARAVAWPAVGPWVERFRTHYGYRPPASEAADEASAVAAGESEQPAGYHYPADAPTTTAAGGLPAEVSAAAGDGLDPPLGSGQRPVTPVPSLAPDADLLAAARDLLGQTEPVGRLGPYDLFTDLGDLDRLHHLDRLAAEIEPAYAARYGRRPIDRPREAVLLFADEAAYRLFQVRETRLAGLPSGGHAGAGMVALYVGQRRRSEVAATLAHELTHMLNRRAIGPALPPWLDEGLADDLGSSWIGPAGDLDPSRLGGEVVRRPGAIDYYGAPASLRQLNAAFSRRSPRLAELVGLDWERFVRADDRGLNYAHAGFFIRYLVAGEEGAHAAAFRRFLDGVAAGGPASGETLRAELGRSWEQLDDGLAAWVRAEVERQATEEAG